MAPPEGLEEGRVRKQRMVGFEPTQRHGTLFKGSARAGSETAAHSVTHCTRQLQGPTPFDSRLWELLLVICLTVNF